MTSKIQKLGMAALGLGAVALSSWYRRTENKETSSLTLPTIDLQKYFDKDKNPEAYQVECKKAADALHTYGALNVRDPRVDAKLNPKFLDMLERYFESSDGKRDARPQYSYQVGVTPEKIEKARNACDFIKGAIGPDNKPLSPCPPELDPKWRFFWRVGERPKDTKFKSLNMDPVIPPEIPEWSNTMDTWGSKMTGALFVLAEMASVGFGLEPQTFPDMMKFGPHLLAPTGSDFSKYGTKDTVLAGFHYDLNFLTIHGKSRFPGLYVWLRDNTKAGVSIPDNCLLVQAGKQIEYLTGGHVLAGFHEVVVTDKTVAAINKAKAEKRSTWRVSSTCFGHIASDQILKPLGRFATPEALAKFPPILAGNQVQKELEAINLAKNAVKDSE